MWTRQYKKSKLRFVVFPAIASVMLSYFAYHGVNGSLGLNSAERFQTEIAELKLELALLEGERTDLSRRTALLRDGSLERDLIDESARHSLGLVRANELILLHSTN